MDYDNGQYYKINRTKICCCIPYDDYIKVDNSDIFIKKDQELNKNTIEQKLKQYKADVEQQKEELREKTSAINEQAKELEKLKQYQAYVEQQNKELMTKTSAIINEQAKELEAIKQKFNDINNRNKVFTNDYLADIKKISQLKKDNNKLSQENTKLKEINKSLHNANLQYKTKIGEDKKLQKEIDGKQNIQESSNKEINELQAQKEKVVKELDEMNKKEKKLENSEEELKELDEIGKLQKEIDEKQNIKESLSKEIDELQAQKEKVVKELDEMNEKEKKLENLEEKKILDMNVDGTDITWRKVLSITNEIVSMRINYLRKMRSRLKDIGRKYNKANAVQKNNMLTDFDVIAWNNKIITDKSGITQDVVNAYNEAITKPSWNGKPSLEIYDEDQKKVVFKQEYNLGKMNDYKVALYIPKQQK